MIDGVTGPGGFGSGLERRRCEPDHGPIATSWWSRWAYSPVNLVTTLVRPGQAAGDGHRPGDQSHITRVHRGHPDLYRLDSKPASTAGTDPGIERVV